MIFSKEINKLLRLSKYEKRILSQIDSIPRRPSEIVKCSKVKNATAYLAFSHLVERGLTKKVTIEGRTYWVLSPTHTLEQFFWKTINDLNHIKEPSVFELHHNEDTSIVIHRGDDAVKKMILGALTLHTGERFSILQSSNKNDGWSRVFGVGNIMKLNKALRDKKIIGESFIPEDYFEQLIPYFGKKWAESYVDRMNIVYLLPPQFFPSHAEILLFKDRAILFHVDGEIAVEIKNKEILLMIKTLFEYLKTTAKKVDPQEFLKKSLVC